ncbi:MAG: TIGR01777 family protein [Chitinophagaceae bacterium]|nr:MAG: TIGR01777 family protein [Chitinophagaceae bacterium]
MSTILITGGTGLIGAALSKELLASGHQLIILTRGTKTSLQAGLRYAAWDPAKGEIDLEAVLEADYIIHLAGAGVAEKRWSKKRKQEILDSRVESGKLLVKTLTTHPNKVKALVSSSAIGYYGADPVIPNPRPFTEDDPASDDFLGKTCVAWEKSLDGLDGLHGTAIRVVKFRTGIVLANEGGALREFAKPLRFGLATILGSGRQVISWIHIGDMVRLYINAVSDPSVTGVFNAVAPKPVSNKELVLKLAKLERKNSFIPIHVPSFALRLAMGEMSTEVLKSSTVSCDKLHIAGFNFLYPSIDAALENLVSQHNP